MTEKEVMPCSPSPASKPEKDETFHKGNLWICGLRLRSRVLGGGHSLPPLCGYLKLGISKYFGYLELEVL